MGVEANPFSGEVVVVEHQPGTRRDLEVVQDLANDGDRLFEIGERQLKVGIADATAAADAAPDVGGEQLIVERLFENFTKLDNVFSGLRGIELEVTELFVMLGVAGGSEGLAAVHGLEQLDIVSADRN